MESVKKMPHNMFVILLAAGLFASFSGTAAEAKNAKDSAPVKAHKQKSLKNYADQDEVLREARKKLEQEKFAEAVDLYNEVLSILELEISEVNGSIARTRYNQVQSEMFKARRAWGAYLMRIARQAASEKRYDEAIRIGSEAAVRDTLLKEESSRFVTFCHGQIRNDKLAKDQGLSAYESKLNAKEQRIKTLLAEANTLYKAGDYMGAVNRAEQVLLLEPTDQDATELAGRAYGKIYRYGNERTRMTSDAMMSVANWQWVEPVFQTIDTNENKNEGALEHDISKLSGAEKLDKIIFPTFNFDEFDLPSVIEFLQSRSKQHDPEGKGVVIENNLPRGADRVTVTMSLSNVPLSTILRVLCLKAGEWKDIFGDGIKYTVSDNGRRVTLSSGSARSGMEERIFPIPGILFRMVQGEGAGAAPAEAPAPETSESEEGGESGGRSVASLTSASAVSTGAGKIERSIPGEKWKTCFRSWLINFPEGSSVFHDPVRSEITVRNTPENLQLLSVVLGQMSAMEDPLVLIEVKAVEISETDYQELGFDWAIANSSAGALKDSEGSKDVTGTIMRRVKKNSTWTLEQGLNTITGAALSPNRTLSGGGSIVKDWNIFSSLFGTSHPFGNDIPFTVKLTINALCQNSRTETVSAPKVITKATPGPGDDNTASVDMGKSYYFPESWEAIEVEIEQSSSDGGKDYFRITPPQPSFGDSSFVGMKFKVTPRLLADNKTIQVDLSVNASTVDTSEKWNIHVRGVKDGKAFDEIYPIFKPSFNERNLKVITHIVDGDTIVVGGMVESQSQTTNDKIPVLGDLPLVGRLFQNSSEDIKRVNLLIFLSARLMKNDGTPLNPSKPTGMPDFNR